MSVIHTNNITNKDGTSGPTISGITTVSSTGFMRVPVGDTRTRLVKDYENIVTDGLVFYIDAAKKESFGGDGTVVKDLSGNNNHGTISGQVGFDAIEGGGAFTFGGTPTNGHIVFDPVVQNFSELSIFSFAKATGNLSAPYNGILSQSIESFPRSDTIALSFFVNTLSGNAGLYGLPSSNTRYTMSSGIISNKIVMYGATVKTGEIRQYLNDSIAASFTHSLTSPIGNIRPFQVGKSIAYPGSLSINYFVGNIHNVLVYNRALTETEIQQNFNALRHRFSI
jgi:hypothetical protein